MIDHSLRRPDELLSDIVEIVETARTLPMSSSCVLPRERLLDLLDGLREALPGELSQARHVLGSRDAMLQSAHDEATHARDSATAQADALLSDATHRSQSMVADATAEAQRILESAQAEHARLVSDTAVHQASAAAAAQMRSAAEDYFALTQTEADQYAADARTEAEQWAYATCQDAERYAAKLSRDAEDYADRTLADMVATLERATATAEQGRAALAQRRIKPQAPAEADPAVLDTGPIERLDREQPISA